MILDELVLQNFGVYRGRQTLQLTPPSARTPIILFGGLNGGGKTTLLDALHLALYGKLARCATRGTLAYETFLTRSVHRAIPPSEGAALEVQFRHTTAGMEHTYRIHRAWAQSGSSMREHVEVHHDGVFDRVLTDAWQEHVEMFIPARITQLFFFDGEQIEGLADVEHSAQVLATAIHALLGLDLVDQLATDLVVLERRKQTALKQEGERQAIEAAKEEVDRLACDRAALVQQRGALQNEADRCQKRLRDVETRLRNAGGDLLDRRAVLEHEHATIAQQLQTTEEALRDLAAGCAPLLLVSDLLAAVDAQDRREEAAAHAAIVGQLLADRDVRLLEEARQHGVAACVVQALNAFLTADRAQQAGAMDIESYIQCSPEARGQLRTLQGHAFPDTHQQVSQLLATAETLQTTLMDLDRQLAAIPDHDALVHLIADQQQARSAVAEAQRRLATLDAELARVTRDHDDKQARMIAAIEQRVDVAFEYDAVTRILQHAQRVRTTLTHFRTAVLQRHVRRIEGLVLESFQHLAHKSSLVTDLSIDPERFCLTLRGPDGRVLLPERLSAGERQLLAVSLLWGLGRASGRPLPVVIDTPLGRLDATHRTHLVERYFPHASHQVLLLSTDEEIDATYLAKLRPWIGRTYRLDFDEAMDATQVRPGYFW